MREVDSEGLLLMDYQGKLFETSVTYLPCSSKIFIRRFFYSSYLKLLDKNNSALLSFDVKEGLDEINNEFGKTKYGKVKYNKDALYWIGYLYRYIAYTRNCRTQFIMKTFSVDLLLRVYESYHTQDMEWVINSLLDIKNLNKEYFDPNYRIKTMLRNKMYNYEYDNNQLIDLIKKYIKHTLSLKEATKTLGCSKTDFSKRVKSYKKGYR